MATCSLVHTTANQPGAIAILQLVGDVTPVLDRVTGINDWPVGRMKLVRFGDIDEGLACRLTVDVAQLMPHGGPRVVRRLTHHLHDCGAALSSPPKVDPLTLYPEAEDEIEARMLGALARAQSPLAIDLLLDQPRRWRQQPTITDVDRARTRRLSRLVDPPRVVLCGPSNVGKSTLSNMLLGRSLSIALDVPGTTRDYTAGRIELAGLVVDWFDTPGLRDTNDRIEARAIELAGEVIASADLLIAMTDAESSWPVLFREPDLLVANKVDLAQRDDADLNISAATGEGLSDLVTVIRQALVRDEDLNHQGPWLFDTALDAPETRHQ